MSKKLLPAIFLALITCAAAAAQEVEVDRYAITARADIAASALDVRAALSVANVGQSSKAKLYLRLTKLAKVSSVTVNGASAQMETADDRRVTTLNQIIITPQAALEAGAKATIEVAYRIEAPESSPLIHIYQGEVLLAPDSVWFPMPTTVFTMYGSTTAPFTLTVTIAGPSGFRAASAGALKGDGGNQTFTFEEPLNSLPFVVAGFFDPPTSLDHGGVKIEIWAQPGLTTATGSDSKAGSIARLGEESGKIIDFLAKIFGPPPAGSSFRVISSVRAGNLPAPGALVLNEQTLRRESLSANTVELLADAIARIWIDGRSRVRGQEARSAQENRPGQRARSAALLHDTLPRYLAALYLEERFGKDAGREAFTRMRWAYTPVAQSGRDAELGLQTVALPNYSAAVWGKGPLVMRLLAETIGREKLLAVFTALLAGPQTRVVTTEDLRGALVKAGGPETENVFQQWIDSIVEPDFVVGVPLPADKPNVQRLNIRNLGAGSATVPVLAVTASGKQVRSAVAIPSEDITSVDIPTGEKIARIEVDPDKLIIQSNYDNDARENSGGPTWTIVISAQTLFNESIAAFNKGEYAEAETKLRLAVRADPHNSLAHAWLGRTLAAEKKWDEASASANAALKIEPPVGAALAWSYMTLGQAALARNQAAEAAGYFRRGLSEAEEAPAQFAARDLLVQAEHAPGASPQIEESVRAFIAQFDANIKQLSSEKLTPLVVKNNLKRFVQGLAVSHPTSWTTEILHMERIDANRVSLDVGLKVKSEGKDQSGTAIFILSRAAAGWVLEDVQAFNVK